MGQQISVVTQKLSHRPNKTNLTTGRQVLSRHQAGRQTDKIQLKFCRMNYSIVHYYYYYTSINVFQLVFGVKPIVRPV